MLVGEHQLLFSVWMGTTAIELYNEWLCSTEMSDFLATSISMSGNNDVSIAECC